MSYTCEHGNDYYRGCRECDAKKAQSANEAQQRQQDLKKAIADAETDHPLGRRRTLSALVALAIAREPVPMECLPALKRLVP